MHAGDPNLNPVYVVFSNAEKPGGPVRGEFGPFANVDLLAEGIWGYGSAERFQLALWEDCRWLVTDGAGEAFGDVEVVSLTGKTTCGELELRLRKGP